MSVSILSDLPDADKAYEIAKNNSIVLEKNEIDSIESHPRFKLCKQHVIDQINVGNLSATCNDPTGCFINYFRKKGYRVDLINLDYNCYLIRWDTSYKNTFWI